MFTGQMFTDFVNECRVGKVQLPEERPSVVTPPVARKRLRATA